MSLLDDIATLQQQAQAELASAADARALEEWRIKYLGTKGQLKALMQRLKEAPADVKPAAGKAANETKNALQTAFDAALAGKGKPQAARTAAIEDVTLPGRQPRIGHSHIISQTIEDICDIFGRMGFEVAYGPEVEDERHNFEALNIPPSHPARDPLDNFFINDHTMLRSQTSTVQIRTMESRQPPVRIVAPGRVYRPDAVDATHSFMFHQIEGLYVDEGVTMADLKTALDQFCKAYFGPTVQTRFRPSFFPFTEPSAEVDLLFEYDDGSTRWIELGGCGMVDPNVLEAVGYDHERYTGYAFGLGIERMVLRKYNIPDIRLLFESDVRFLHQF
ncbi:MAG: phenylalanine--tRNA ligase subunit alpha [Planctomycetaceae bacterium]|nr:phenylalanine--tRNA ligase subunit alpha [Planctomycetaceae bacterium]